MQKGILSNAAPLAAFASRRCRGATLVMRQLSSSKTPPTCPPPINQLQPEWFSSAPPEMAALNKRVIAEAEKTPTMMELGVSAYRTLRHAAFKHGDPARCVDVSLAGLDGSPDVAARLFFPSAAAKAMPRGALLHLHGGGFVIGSAMGQNDERLLRHAEACGLTVVSVDYRLSPEHTHPAALDDCHAAALWLDSPEGRAAARIGPEAPLLMVGESAGGDLAAACSSASRANLLCALPGPSCRLPRRVAARPPPAAGAAIALCGGRPDLRMVRSRRDALLQGVGREETGRDRE
mmetsp:Transcript_29166/g.97697  ORF Transcript_29166/g.97697 Transcript_29166/m.97697 type:complete len:292 (-) Transcript_29166:95-970(-)